MDRDPKPRILLVDDSPAYRRVIQSMLGPGYEFLQAGSGEEALPHMVPFQPDLIISDLIMPGIDGYELCRRVRAEPALANVPVILLTSKSGDDSRITGLEIGADDYLTKPIRARELAARVSSLLRLRRATLDLQKAQSELIRSEKLASLGQLVAGIAHELNNPLNYIYGNVEFLSDYVRAFLTLFERVEAMPGLNETQRAYLTRVKTETDIDFVRGDVGKLLEGVKIGAERAAEIVKGLRAFARAGTSMELEEVRLVDVVELALTILRHELRDRIRVHKSFAAVRPVLCDGSRLSQVFVNLLLNAIQSIPGEGDITVELAEDDGQARCTAGGSPSTARPARARRSACGCRSDRPRRRVEHRTV
jgi:CheY-like chemotaxis protein